MLHPLIREINAVALTAETSDLAVWHQALAERLTTAVHEANQRGRAGWPAAVRHTLNDRTRVLGPEHPHTLASRDSLGLVPDGMGEHAQAVRMHRSTLDDRTRIPSSAEHPHTLSTRNALENGHRAVGGTGGGAGTSPPVAGQERRRRWRGESMMPAVGSAARPSLMRTLPRSRSWNAASRPWRRQRRKNA
ncbi:tetratricopeptide repeat protein [Streptomyces lavendulae]|uniref:tetratricopeptide repeat protein n=1 Tax=Streptomyces lavendulae TaxID=1914 RepID=UPI0033ED40C5